VGFARHQRLDIRQKQQKFHGLFGKMPGDGIDCRADR
jgi:hypothetical protein